MSSKNIAPKGLPVPTTMALCKEGRRVGNTTRQVDFAINQLFHHVSVLVKDHHNSKVTNQMLMNKILHRLDTEHKVSLENDNLEVDFKNFIITLK